MSAIRNQVQLIGNLGQKPEIKAYGKDQKMAVLNIATSDYYTDNKGERKQDTQWHKVIVFGKQVETIEKYLDKGMQVAITGKLKYNEYNDKDGNKRYSTDIVANEFILLEKKTN
ncbi:MAG: single-stranded DNA-binding protein [Chitinophagales bacterium]